MPNHAVSLDRVFQALADPTRRAVLMRLREGPASAGELAKPFAITMPSLLQHLHVLERSGLIRTAKVGRVRTCEIEAAALAAAEAWLSAQRAVWEARLDRMEAYVATLAEGETQNAETRKKPR